MFFEKFTIQAARDSQPSNSFWLVLTEKTRTTRVSKTKRLIFLRIDFDDILRIMTVKNKLRGRVRLEKGNSFITRRDFTMGRHSRFANNNVYFRLNRSQTIVKLADKYPVTISTVNSPRNKKFFIIRTPRHRP